MKAAEKVKVIIDADDVWQDILVHYKSGKVDLEKQLRIKISHAPANDTGGVRRQIYSTVYSDFQHNKYIRLFTGPSHSLNPVYTAEARSSGLFKVLGTMVGRSICQDGIGFPFFSLANYYYIVEGEEKALQVCSVSDIGADVAEVVSKV
uniref:HECT domain-containing protein n=1 Tax=Amphimedon queenslandica TaxID=400682 RepID=A0A1X7UXI7_AMPQE